MIQRALGIAAALALAACASRLAPPEEPIVDTVEVDIPIPTSCIDQGMLGSEPEYVDTDMALASAGDILALVRLYKAGRLQRIQRDAEKSAVIMGCVQ